MKFFVFLITFTFSSSGLAASYYVNAELGNDNAIGTSQEQPWQTVSRVNAMELGAGDIVKFAGGQTYPGTLTVTAFGFSASPVLISSYGSNDRATISRMDISGDWIIVENFVVDQEGGNSDAVRVRNASNLTIQNVEIRNGTKDGIDVVGAENVSFLDLHIHHLLAGSYTEQADAHGIALSDAHNVSIDQVNIHHVSGDSIQVDPNRSPGEISSDITITNATLWTGPLADDFNSEWRSGDVPGENALDTKVLSSGFENEPRMRIELRDIVAYGFTKGTYISNRAAFNLKEKVEVIFDGVTVHDSEIAFRIRGNRGNADVEINNALIYSVDVGFRTESDVENLQTNHVTFGGDVTDVLKRVDSGSSLPGWNWRNVVSLEADGDLDALNVANAALSDFVAAEAHDYRPTPGSNLVDVGVPSEVSTDIDGHPRDEQPDIGAFEYIGSVPNPPVVLQANN